MTAHDATPADAAYRRFQVRTLRPGEGYDLLFYDKESALMRRSPENFSTHEAALAAAKEMDRAQKRPSDWAVAWKLAWKL